MTCRYYSITRQSFYLWKRRYEELGPEGLRDRSRPPTSSPNATHADVVGTILYLRQNDHFGPGKVELSHRIDAEEFYRMLDGVVIDDTGLFNEKLQEWENF
jgi:hypothetical protein